MIAEEAAVVASGVVSEPGPAINLDGDHKLSHVSKPPPSASPVRVLIIGAGSRGQAYANAIGLATNGIVAAVAEPHPFKRRQFAQTYINLPGNEKAITQYSSWTYFILYETERRQRKARGESNVPLGVDAVFVCVLDEMHREVVVAITKAFPDLHIMCEKPLATNLADCVAIYRAMHGDGTKRTIFSIGHVLRYSPHNVALRKLLLEDEVIGDILSIVHTEPVGWWHFTHSYVRGNWRREDTSGPSLLTKSCHDIDVLLWLLCSPTSFQGDSNQQPHLPAKVSSSGRLQYFKKNRKPIEAGNATNCLSCPIEDKCKYSAKRIYLGDKPFMGLATDNINWPVSIVLPEIEDLSTKPQREQALLAKLSEDYTSTTPDSEVSKRNWFGRCVYESDNDVLDEQIVTISWDDQISSKDNKTLLQGSKQATFHMVAQTKHQCERFTRIYGTDGEIYADSYTITVEDFNTHATTTHNPRMESRGHGGGDIGLTRQFMHAVDLVKNHGWEAEKAQKEVVRCTVEEVLRSHALVFCAEEARKQGRTIDWEEWWAREVKGNLGESK